MFNSFQSYLNSNSHVYLRPPCRAAQVWPLPHKALSVTQCGSLGCTLPPCTSPRLPTRTPSGGQGTSHLRVSDRCGSGGPVGRAARGSHP